MSTLVFFQHLLLLLLTVLTLSWISFLLRKGLALSPIVGLSRLFLLVTLILSALLLLSLDVLLCAALFLEGRREVLLVEGTFSTGIQQKHREESKAV